ncbi:MAG TPA: class I SAM-dependent methyltransferase [Thermoanaerobaculia bacterium]|nr:class I SAM-dependent methyltransferase [Thermoanaerobaculia bacterium]
MTAPDRFDLVGLLLERFGLPPTVEREIAAEDEMLLWPLEHHGGDLALARADYFADGVRILSLLRQIVAWRWGSWERVGSLLDFAAGYGRLTRLLVHTLPPERLAVAEILPGALDFQRERFGVATLPSTAQPERFACERTFQLVLAGSLFTHLPRAAFTGWLGRLAALVAPGGLLVFSAHDLGLRSPAEVPPADGFLFEPRSESRALAREEYGSTWVSEAFVRAALAEAAPGRDCLRLPRAYCGFQDLYLVGAPGETLAPPPGLDPGPEGHLDRVAFPRRDRLTLSGWARDRAADAPPTAVEIHLGDGRAHRLSEYSSRPDLPWPEPCAWHLEVALPPHADPGSWPLLVLAHGAGGAVSILHAGTIASAHTTAERLRRDALFTESVTSHVRLGWEHEVLKARLAAMEASRFWKLRERWFAWKRALGLAGER